MSFVRYSNRNRQREREVENDGQDLVDLPVVQPRRRIRGRNEPVADLAQPAERIATRGTTLTGRLRYLEQHHVEVQYLRMNPRNREQAQAIDYVLRGTRSVRFRHVQEENLPLHILQVSMRSFERYLTSIRPILVQALNAAWTELGPFRVALHMDIEVQELNDLLMGDHPIPIPGSLTSNTSTGPGDLPVPPVEGVFQIQNVLETMLRKIRTDLERMQSQGSQMIFHLVQRTRLSCASMGLRRSQQRVARRVRAGLGSPLETQPGWDELKMPSLLRRCVTNVYTREEDDDMCFYYAVWYGMLRKLAPANLLPDENEGEVAVLQSDMDVLNVHFPALQILHKLSTENPDLFPMHPNDIYRVDMQLQKEGFALNAYHYQGNEHVIGTLFTSHAAHREGIKHIDLLLINTEDDAKHPINHWVLITDFPMLVSANEMFQKAYKHLKSKKRAMLRICAKALDHDWVCRICFKKCKSDEEYTVHTRLCTLDRLGGKGCTEVYSTPEKAHFGFHDYSKMFLDPFVVYADFECLVQQMQTEEEGANTIQDQRHIPISCALRVSSSHEVFQDWIPPLYQGILMLMDQHVCMDSLQISKTTNVAKQLIRQLIELRQSIVARMMDADYLWDTPYSVSDYTNLHPENSECCCFCRIALGIQNLNHPLYEDQDAFDRGTCVAFQPFASLEEDERVLGLAHRLCFWKFLGAPYSYSGKFGNNQTKAIQEYNTRVKNLPHLFHDEYASLQMEELFADLVERVGHRFYYEKYTLKIFFHNLTGYDGHLLIQALEEEHVDIRAIPQTGDKFLSLQFSGLHFLDSYKFLKGSLDDLARTVIMCHPEGDEMVFEHEGERQKSLALMRSGLEQIGVRFGVTMTEQRVSLLLRKGVFPYEYFQTPEVLKETCLPPMEAFDSKLYDAHISEADYRHAQRVWESFGMQTFQDYHDLYLYVDVMLLHMVFERFRIEEYNKNGMDVTRFYSLPGYAYAQCLYLADPLPEKPNSIFQLDLLHNQQSEIVKMFEGMKRGGISCIMTRHAQIEDPETEEIKLFDANNLYGYAMEQPLPIGGYRYLSQVEIDQFLEYNMLETYDRLQSRKGYVLEVDLHLPLDLHEKFRYYPMFPIKRTISYEETSEYYRSQKEERDHDGKTEKLVLDMHDRFYYSTHVGMLQLGLKEGYVLKKVHRILEYDQHPWMRSHIQRQTEARQKATTAIGKDIPKLIANSTYGKTIEDSRRHQTVKIVTEAEQFTKSVRSPLYQSHRIVNEGIAVVQQRKTRIHMNRPVMVGIIVLELSKLLMYEFYYQVLYRTFGDRLRLLMTDTDSLGIHVTGLKEGGILEELKEYHDSWFDLANYPSEKNYSTKNNKVVGKMKDEFIKDKTQTESAKIKVCEEFIGLKSKMLCFRFREEKDKIVGKGISRTVLKKHITFQSFKQAMFGDTSVPTMEMRSIRSQNNRLYTYRMHKSTLDGLDDKVYLENRTECVPYGYVSSCMS